MGSKAIVVYKSKYGSAKQYADWLAEALGCPARRAEEVTPGELEACDTIIFGGGLYAGSINGAKLIIGNWEQLKNKKIAVFAVGMTPPAAAAIWQPVWENSFNAEQRERIRCFALQGGMDYSKMTFFDKTLMKVFQSILKKKKDRSETEQAIVDSYGKTQHREDQAAIAPIVAWAEA